MNQNYIMYLKASGKSEKNTIIPYVKYVNNMLNFIGKDEANITGEDMLNWQNSLAGLSSATIDLQIDAVHSYFKFLTRFNIIKDDPSQMLIAPKVEHKEKPYMSKEMVRRMIDCADTLRDKAIIMTFASTGLRVSELSNITLDDYNNAIHNGNELIIEGKGRKQRTVYINNTTKEAINNYLASKPIGDTHWLFKSKTGNKLSPNSLSQTLKKIARWADIPFWKDMSNHYLRSAFATIASENGIAVSVISKAMGHSSISTTSVYIKNNQNQINEAMKSMIF